MMINGKENIDTARLLTLRAVLKLETKGLSMSKGRTAYSIIKKEFNIKGNKINVLRQYENILKEKYGLTLN